MKTYKNPIHYREFSIVIGIAILLLIISSIPYKGLALDFTISKNLYNPADPNWFGILMSGIAEWPGYLAVVFAGSALIATRNKENKTKLVFAYILGILAIVAGSFLAWNTFQNISKFPNKSDSKLFTQIFGMGLLLVTAGPIVYFTIAMGNKFQKDILFRVAFMILIIAVSEIAIFSLLKYVWSRPRPRYIFSDDVINPKDAFRPWWSPQFFKAMDSGLYHESSNATSFPSGHTATSALSIIAIPLFISLFKKVRDNKLTNILGFYLGVLWTLLTLFSRILAGAHFLSDTAMGMFITIAVSVIVIYLDFHLHNVEIKDDEMVKEEVGETSEKIEEVPVIEVNNVDKIDENKKVQKKEKPKSKKK